MTPSSRLRARRCARRPATGGAAVEFALVLPLFMLVVMGALDYGYYFFSEQVSTNSAREGARAGTLVDPGSNPVPVNQATAVGNAISAATQYMTNNGVGCVGVCIGARVCPTGATAGMTISGSCPAIAGGDYAIEVQIKYPAVSLTGFTQVALPQHVFADSVMLWK